MAVKSQLIDNSTWNQTALAGSWQVHSGSDLSYVCLPDLDTVPQEDAIVITVDPGSIGYSLFAFERIEVHHRTEADNLSRGLRALMAVSPAPDEPSDEDVNSRSYVFPD